MIAAETISDEAGFAQYRPAVPPTVSAFGGKFVVRGGNFTNLEGEWPHPRLVIIEFPSRDAAEGWYNSPAYQEIVALRHKSSVGNLIIIDGPAESTVDRLSLRRATPGDLPFIMETERLPGFDKMVGRWTTDQHEAALSRPSYAYLIGTEVGGEAFGFAIIRDLDDSHGNVCLKRIAIASPGRGYGTRFLGMVLDWVFREATAYRVWLDVLADNDRARHVYTRAGFVEEGLLRRAYKLPDKTRIDLILMSILQPEWLKQQSTRSAE